MNRMPLSLVGLNSCQPEHVLCQFRLLEWLSSVLRTDFTISHGRFSRRADVAIKYQVGPSVSRDYNSPMWPVCSANALVEAVLLEFELLICDKSSGRHTNVLDMANSVSFRKACVMHSATVPENKVTRLHVDLDHLAASVFKPFEVCGVEQKKVHILQLWGWRILMRIEFARGGKEFVEELGGSFHQHQAAILWSVRCVVQETLNSLHPV